LGAMYLFPNLQEEIINGLPYNNVSAVRDFMEMTNISANNLLLYFSFGLKYGEITIDPVPDTYIFLIGNNVGVFDIKSVNRFISFSSTGPLEWFIEMECVIFMVIDV
jgi:hypothetical protein